MDGLIELYNSQYNYINISQKCEATHNGIIIVMDITRQYIHYEKQKGINKPDQSIFINNRKGEA